MSEPLPYDPEKALEMLRFYDVKAGEAEHEADELRDKADWFDRIVADLRAREFDLRARLVADRVIEEEAARG